MSSINDPRSRFRGDSFQTVVDRFGRTWEKCGPLCELKVADSGQVVCAKCALKNEAPAAVTQAEDLEWDQY